MTNVFQDQAKFMAACDQTVGEFNINQLNMYLNLIKEEGDELSDAVKAMDKVATLDALLDILVVTVGTLHSMGVYPEDAWNEVMRSNMDKIDPKTGKVTKREDGKVLKPDGWTAPELAQFIKE